MITIQVPWENPYDKDYMWNELLAWTMETYGLPGNRWTYHPTENFMDFHFPDEKDSLMFQLKTSGHRVSENETTLNFITNRWLS